MHPGPVVLTGTTQRFAVHRDATQPVTDVRVDAVVVPPVVVRLVVVRPVVVRLVVVLVAGSLASSDGRCWCWFWWVTVLGCCPTVDDVIEFLRVNRVQCASDRRIGRLQVSAGGQRATRPEPGEDFLRDRVDPFGDRGQALMPS